MPLQSVAMERLRIMFGSDLDIRQQQTEYDGMVYTLKRNFHCFCEKFAKSIVTSYLYSEVWDSTHGFTSVAYTRILYGFQTVR